MWTTESLWFEVAVVSIIFAVGNMVFGHFEEQTPKARRVAKYFLIVAVVCLLSFYLGRTVALSILALFFLPFIYVHGFYLPRKKGINGLTGEPKSRYYEFRKWDTDIFDKE